MLNILKEWHENSKFRILVCMQNYCIEQDNKVKLIENTAKIVVSAQIMNLQQILWFLIQANTLLGSQSK